MKRNRLKKCSHNLLLIGIDPPVGEWRKQTMKRTYEKEAAQFCEYIRTLASSRTTWTICNPIFPNILGTG